MYIDFLPVFDYYVHMSPRIRKPEIDTYRPKLSVEARDALTELADELNFITTRKGTYDGLPSVPDFLTALAAVYRLDPVGTQRVLAVVLDAHGLRPARLEHPADATPPE